jgi:hypothetical protein
MSKNEFTRGSLATVRATNRRVQVHRVVEAGGRVMLDCKSADRVPEDDRLYHPAELIHCLGAAKVLPPE